MFALLAFVVAASATYIQLTDGNNGLLGIMDMGKCVVGTNQQTQADIPYKLEKVSDTQYKQVQYSDYGCTLKTGETAPMNLPTGAKFIEKLPAHVGYIGTSKSAGCPGYENFNTYTLVLDKCIKVAGTNYYMKYYVDGVYILEEYYSDDQCKTVYTPPTKKATLDMVCDLCVYDKTNPNTDYQYYYCRQYGDKTTEKTAKYVVVPTPVEHTIGIIDLKKCVEVKLTDGSYVRMQLRKVSSTVYRCYTYSPKRIRHNTQSVEIPLIFIQKQKSGLKRGKPKSFILMFLEIICVLMFASYQAGDRSRCARPSAHDL